LRDKEKGKKKGTDWQYPTLGTARRSQAFKKKKKKKWLPFGRKKGKRGKKGGTGPCLPHQKTARGLGADGRGEKKGRKGCRLPAGKKKKTAKPKLPGQRENCSRRIKKKKRGGDPPPSFHSDRGGGRMGGEGKGPVMGRLPFFLDRVCRLFVWERGEKGTKSGFSFFRGKEKEKGPPPHFKGLPAAPFEAKPYQPEGEEKKGGLACEKKSPSD